LAKNYIKSTTMNRIQIPNINKKKGLKINLGKTNVKETNDPKIESDITI